MTMNVVKICGLLATLNKNTPSEHTGNVMELLTQNVNSCQERFNFDDDDLNLRLAENALGANPVSSYLVLNFELFNQLKCIFANSNDMINLLSIQQNKIVRDAIQQWLAVGIRFNLLPKLPQRLQPPSAAYRNEAKTIHTDYDRLCYTTCRCIDLLVCNTLRPLLVFVGFEILLNGLYQIVYCPLKKPDEERITQQLYDKFTNDKERFQLLLEHVSTIMPTSIYAKETMLLLNSDCAWFRRAASANLTHILRSKNGLRVVIHALLENSQDYDSYDNSTSWKALDLIVKLLISLKDAADFEENICAQICGLLKNDTSEKSVLRANRPYERIFVATIKYLYVHDIALCRRQFLPLLFDPLHRKCENNDVTGMMWGVMRLLNDAFVDCKCNETALSCVELDSHIAIVFRLFASLGKVSDEKALKRNETIAELYENSKLLLIHYLRNSKDANAAFDRLIDRTQIKDFVFDASTYKIHVLTEPAKVKATTDFTFSSHAVLKAIKKHHDLEIAFFLYLLNCLRHKDDYCTGSDFHAIIERNLIAYNLLSTMVEDIDMQKYITDNPHTVVSYIGEMLKSAIERGVHKSMEAYETSDYQTTFLLIMILQALTTSYQQNSQTDVYKDVLEPLQQIRDQCMNEELRQLTISVINALHGDATKKKHVGKVNQTTSNRLEEVLESICDPLLPIRGHGLMMLAQLVEENDPEVLERKLFVLNVFKQNLKNEDSFIYLAAINGLATLADSFPGCVLSTISDEYAGFDSFAGEPEGHEVRMKLGEVLLKATRKLGQKAVAHKTILLNAFMAATKDDDHLMRASSLSNLGEICRVLGFRLGSIVNEVLDCIHGVIQRDPAIEARRAAVSVVRQLFVGLEKETLVFLQDDILRIYRTLKEIYRKDSDEIMRLQAQLALEELNVNVKAFLFSHLTLSEDSL